MDKENNVVYVETKKGIFKCYKSEQMHKPIYYPIESKTNGYIDYNDVIRILNIDDLYEQVKKQKEVINNAIEYIEKHTYHDTPKKLQNGIYERGELIIKNDFYIEDLVDILKEVSE